MTNADEIDNRALPARQAPSRCAAGSVRRQCLDGDVGQAAVAPRRLFLLARQYERHIEAVALRELPRVLDDDADAAR